MAQLHPLAPTIECVWFLANLCASMLNSCHSSSQKFLLSLGTSLGNFLNFKSSITLVLKIELVPMELLLFFEHLLHNR